MIVDSALYRNGERVELACHPHEYDVLRAGVHSPGDFVWLGLYRPSESELGEVAEAFGLHPLAVEDALKAHQRPKLERYGEVMFLVLKTLWYVDADDAVDQAQVFAMFERNLARLKALLAGVIATLPPVGGCGCAGWREGLDLPRELA